MEEPGDRRQKDPAQTEKKIYGILAEKNALGSTGVPAGPAVCNSTTDGQNDKGCSCKRQNLKVPREEYFRDGCACVVVNGDVVAQGSQFSLRDVEVITAILDLDTVSSYRGAISSLREQATQQSFIPCVHVDFTFVQPDSYARGFPSLPIAIRYHAPEEEIALGPACWLWDYLRRSGATGFLLPLSGGADSSSVAAIVGSMCQQVIKAQTRHAIVLFICQSRSEPHI